MAITNYGQLKTAAANWLDRTDLEDRIPEFVTMAEAQFNREIRQPQMITRDDSFTIDGQYEAMPTDALEIQRIVLDQTPMITLQYITPNEISEKRSGLTGTGRPIYYSIVGENMEFVRTPDSAYTASIMYYKRITALSADGDTNWLLTNHPDIYLYGTLLQSAPFLMFDERIPVWQSLLMERLDQLKIQGERETHGSPIRMMAQSLGQ